MNDQKDDRKEELLELFIKTSFMPYAEVLELLQKCCPTHINFIKRKLEEDLREFKLKVYFWESFYPGGSFPLLNPEFATKESLHFYVIPEENYANFWLLGELSTEDLKCWLRNENVEIPSLGIESANVPAYMNPTHEKYAPKLAIAVKAWEHFYINGLTYPNRSPKDNIKAWLEENAESSSLSKEAKEEIAKIVNWQPKGGAPKSQ